MFFESCKLTLKKHEDYLAFINHFTDVLHGKSDVGVSVDQYPVYVFADEFLGLEYTYDKSEYDRRKIKRVSLKTFLDMKYTISYHFKSRFFERFDKVSETRLRKLVGNMLDRGKWMKRKDSIKLVKYKKTSDYVLYSQYENDGKKHYLVVLTDQNILTTIYEFDIKDLKYFRET